MTRPSIQTSHTAAHLRFDTQPQPVGEVCRVPPSVALPPVYSEPSEQLKQALFNNLYCEQGKDEQFANAHDYYMALAYSVRNDLMKKRIRTAKTYAQSKAKAVYYLSAEFLMGRHLGNGLINLGLHETMRHTLADMGLDLDELLEREAEPGLGNGGLGRLAACFMDSLTTLNLPAIGYGIRYEFGIFTQIIHNGHQHEQPDKWLSFGNPGRSPAPIIG